MKNIEKTVTGNNNFRVDGIHWVCNGNLAAKLQVGNITLRLFNGADEHLIQNTLRCIRGMNHTW